MEDHTLMQQWFTEQVRYLFAALDAIPEGNGTVLDNTIILWGNELGNPSSHSNMGVPMILAGGAGKFRMGRYLKFATRTTGGCSGGACKPTVPHNQVLVSILQAFGLDQNTFGSPNYSGTLPGLT
jgi:hypothetical protein